MAIKEYNVLSNENQHVSVPFNYTRGSAMPLDNSTNWPTLSDAQNYADGTTTGYGVPYVGQFITVTGSDGVSAYVIQDTAGTLKMLATGGDAAAIEAKLNQEIADRKAADTYLSNTLSTRIDNTDLSVSRISSAVELSVGNLEKNLSVTVEALATAEEGYLSTYVIKQGGNQVGAKINIPKDKVVDSADVVVFKTDEEATSQSGGKVTKAGTYIKITFENKDTVYIDVPELANIYKGGTTDTISVIVANDQTTGSYTISAEVRDSSVTTAKLVDSSVTTAKIADSNVTTAKIANKNVTTEKIADGAVGTTQLSADAVTNDKLADNAVQTENIVDGAVTTDKIADDAVTNDKIAADAVGTEQLSADAVTNAKLADNAVQEENIKNSAVTTDKIADDAVTNAKIAVNAVGTEQLSANAVTTSKIADGAINSDKLADNAVTTGKIADGAVETNDIKDLAVTHAKIATDAIESVNILSGSITTIKIADKNVTTEKIDDSAVTEVKLATDAVTTSKIKDNAVTESKILSSAVTTEKIKDGNVTKAKLATDVITWGESLSTQALTDSKAYSGELCSSISTTVDTKLASMDGAYKEADKALSNTISTWVNTKVANLTADLTGTAGQVVTGVKQEDGKITSVYTKQLGTSDLSDWTTEKDGIKTELSNTLSTYANQTSAYALSEAKTYSDGNLETAKAYADKQISSIGNATVIDGELITAIGVGSDGKLSASTRAITSADISDLGTFRSDLVTEVESYADAKDGELKNELTGVISTVSATTLLSAAADATAKANAAQAAGELSAQAVRNDLTGYVKYTDVKGGSEVITDTNKLVTQKDIAALTGVMHFVGTTTDTNLSDGYTGKPTGVYAEDVNPVQGDFVLRTDNAKEFVYVGTWNTGSWTEIGDEDLYAKRTELEAETASRKADDLVLSNAITAEVAARKADDLYLSSQISGNLTAFNEWKSSVNVSVDNLSTALKSETEAREATDTRLTGLSSEFKTVSASIALSIDNLSTYAEGLNTAIETEATTRAAADTALSTAIDAKITVDGVNPENLSVEHISQSDYHTKVVAGTALSNVIYVVSSDNLDMYGEQIKNLAKATELSDATPLYQVNETAISAANYAVAEASAINKITLNGVDFVMAANGTGYSATLSIDYIDCNG